MIELRDIPFCAPLGHDFTTVDVAIGHSSRLNRNGATLRACVAKLTRWRVFHLFLVFSCCLPFALCGCLGGKIIVPAADAGSLQASTTAISFGGVTLGQTASSSISVVNQGSAAVEVSQMTVAGQAFSVSGEGDLPVKVAAGGTYSFSVNFSPATTGASTGQLTITSNSTVNGMLVIGLSGTGTAASSTSSTSLSALSCASGSMTGPGRTVAQSF